MYKSVITKMIPGLLCVTGLFVSCTKEYQSDCQYGARIRYEYTLNNQDVDLFGPEVHRMAIYIFDDKELFYDSVIIDNPELLGNDHTIRLPLKTGRYTLLSWGGQMSHYRVGDKRNLNDPSSFVDGLTKGSTSIDHFRLQVKLSDNPDPSEVVDNLNDLYYGAKTTLDIPSNGQIVDKTIHSIKNTNNIKVTVTGLTNLTTRFTGARPFINELPLDIYCVGANGVYSALNEISQYASEVKYTPDAIQLTSNQVDAEMRILRMVKDIRDHKPIHLIIRDRISGRLLYNKNIINELISLLDNLGNPVYLSQDDLDREDTYHFRFNISSDLSVSVTVNGWAINSIDKPFGR